MAAKTPAQKREQEKQTVGLMIELYCHGHHGTRGMPSARTVRLCAAMPMPGDHCPHMETKTFCSACKTHCYKPQMRGGHPPGHALERPADDLPPPRPGDTAFDRDEKNRKSNMPLQIGGNTEKAPSQRKPFSV